MEIEEELQHYFGHENSFNFGNNWRYNEHILQDTRIDFADDEDVSCSDTFDSHNNNNVNRMWEVCGTCNDAQSFPANERLKEELRKDGEDLISDLNFAQKMFIGNWDDDNEDYSLEMPTADSIVDNRAYQSVNKFVDNLLKPENTETMARVLDTTIKWEEDCNTELLPFTYLFNCRRENDAKSLEKQPPVEKMPPDKQSPQLSESFRNLCNYIDSGVWAETKSNLICSLQELLQLEKVVSRSRFERKRRHSACRNYYSNQHRKQFDDFDRIGEDDGGKFIKNDLGIGIGFDPGLLIDGIGTSPKLYYGMDSDLNFFAKYWATDASLILKNNNLLLKQIEISRPLTR